VVGTLCCVCWWAVTRAAGCLPRGEPLLGKPRYRGWLVVRGLFGIVENASAWVALRYLDMADANVLMFTSPLFTGLFALLLLGQRWRWYDNLLTLTSLVGVVLVVRPAFLFDRLGPLGFHGFHGGDAHDGDSGGDGSAASGSGGGGAAAWEHWVGVAAGLTFGVTLAAENLIIHAKITAVPTNTITLYMFVGVAVATSATLLWVPPAGFLAHGLATPQPYLMLGIGLLFALFQYSRSKAFQLSHDTAVVNLLYCELVFAFAWGVWLLGQPLVCPTPAPGAAPAGAAVSAPPAPRRSGRRWRGLVSSSPVRWPPAGPSRGTRHAGGGRCCASRAFRRPWSGERWRRARRCAIVFVLHNNTSDVNTSAASIPAGDAAREVLLSRC
jgi:drug/metabolite transporter (DMT)-like permease